MFKSILLSLFVAFLACDLISEKGGHALLLKLEKELMNYNAKIKQEKITYEKEKKQTLASKPNNHQAPILSQETTKHLNNQIHKSKELEKKCNEIIKSTSQTIKEMETLYNKTIKMKEEADKINKEFENSRYPGYSNSNWSLDKKIKVDQLNQQIQDKISSAKNWPKETKQLYQSLKDRIDTVVNNAIKHIYHLEKDIRTGQIPEDWISRISDHIQSANEIIKQCEKTLKESAKQSAETANNYVKELEDKVQEALRIIESNNI